MFFYNFITPKTDLTLQILKKTLLQFVFFYFMFLTVFGYGQEHIDAFQQKTYKELYTLIKQSKKVNEKEFCANEYVKKAKKETNTNELIKGYYTLSRIHGNNEKTLFYADSIIALTTAGGNKEYPAKAYQRKGNYYYTIRDYKNAIDNYLIFDSLARKYNYKKNIFYSNLNIGNLKRQIEDFEKALNLYRENFSYTQKNQASTSNRNHLASIISIANVFNDLHIVDSATYYNSLGVKESLRLKNPFYFALFALNQGVTHYYNKEYIIAIDSIEKHIPYFEKDKNIEELSFAYFYLGKVHINLHNEEKAIGYFKKVDTIFQKTKTLYPTIREAYIHLNKYYKEQKDSLHQITYLTQIHRIDNTLDSIKTYLNSEITEKYDIPKRIEPLRSKIESQKSVFKKTTIVLSILIGILCIAFGVQFKKRQQYKKRFQEILSKERKVNSPTKSIVKEVDTVTINVPDKIIQEILLKLEIFEENNAFTSNGITLQSLAKKLNTNANYLSKVINHYKKASFTNYLSKLRIEYTIEELKTNPTYQKYTVKAIAEEVGFNNVQSFVKAFYTSKGIKPSYFIRELKKLS